MNVGKEKTSQMIFIHALAFTALIVATVYWAMSELSIHYPEIF